MNLDLTGKTAVVCGSTQGIGRASAEELALLGARIILMARNPGSLEQVADQLATPSGQEHGFLAADFSDPSAVQTAVNEWVAAGNVAEILVNNTGGPPAAPAMDATIEEFRIGFNNHLICNHILVQALVPGMKSREYGRIINIISTSVKTPIAGLGVSNTTRGAVANWAKTLASELAPFGITVNNMLPGMCWTGRLESLINGRANKQGISQEEVAAKMKSEIPAGRFGESAELGAVVAFLATPAAAYVNGTNVPVDGGENAMSVVQIENLIDGQLQSPASGAWLDNVNPGTGEVYSQVPDSGAGDVDAAVASATRAFPAWSGKSAGERAKVLHRIADLVDQNRERLVLAETDDNGKPLRLSRSVDIPRVSTNLRFYAGMVEGFASESHAMPGAINYTLRTPLGVVACISPWNLPLYLLTWKIAPALATGNCVIAKPSEVTPMTAYLFSELCIEAGLPPGVLSIVHGSGATTGNAMLTHPGISAVSFTGGTTTGEHIARTVAPQFKKLSLELGGKNPNIIFADCNYERMMQTTLLSSFSNQGQICLCGSRVIVERPMYEQFVDDFVKRAKDLRVGDPLDKDSDLGAVVSQSHQQKILGCIETAKAEGGHLHCGGGPANINGRCENGFFVQPTVFTGLGPDSQTNQQEIFGPVVSIQPFDDEAHALALANDSRYGLSATVWTENIGCGHRMAERIESGVVWVNCWLVRDLRTPFGGMKSSGLGREGGLESLRFFTEPKNVCVKY